MKVSESTICVDVNLHDTGAAAVAAAVTSGGKPSWRQMHRLRGSLIERPQRQSSSWRAMLETESWRAKA